MSEMIAEAAATRGWKPPFIGGHVALDLLNTVSWRTDEGRRRDNLVSSGALRGWCVDAGVLTRSEAEDLDRHGDASAAAVAALNDVVVLREHTAAFCAAIALLDPDQDVGVGLPDTLRGQLSSATGRAELTGLPARWTLPVTQWEHVAPRLALEVLDLVQASDLARLRRCEGPGCGWFFVDTTRSHTRRYCITADCGNRDRARRHYRRHHQPATTDRDSSAAGRLASTAQTE